MEPIIKVRYREKFLFLFLVFLSSVHSVPICDKTPVGQGDKIPGDNGFAIQLSGSPRKYRPNQVYTIKLSGMHEEHPAKFQGFMMVAEPSPGNMAIQSPTSLGTFQLLPGDAMTKFSHKCSHSVEATSSMNKEHITVYWTSPPQGAGCIDFKAMVVERQDVWYMDDGALTYMMCEDDGPLSEPIEVEPCCACDEAKYEVIFEGIWSRHTHPKDFPRDEWRTMFSTLIGASHSTDYTLWEYGRQASPSLQVLAEDGNTMRLEREMKKFSGNIRSVVKAHGLQQRSNVVGQTFAVFRVDRIHHLLSVVSKMVPSPDWIVGLSKENLCLANCSWVDNRVIDLYPWDTGTDGGLRYDGASNPQRPKGNIQRITSSDPHSEESPFYDLTGAPMKPAARLHLIKQREYFKTCPEGVQRPGLTQGGDISASTVDEYDSLGSNDYGDYNAQDPTSNYDNLYDGSDYSSNLEYSNDDPCTTTEWEDWTQCSATCGSASKSRQRLYTDPGNAQRSACQEELFEKTPCQYLPQCPVKSYAGSFNPFEVDQMSGYSTPWLERGLEAENQIKTGISYNYESNNRNVPTYSSSNSNSRQQVGYGQNPGYSNDYPSPYGNSYTYGGSSGNSDSETVPMPERLNSPSNPSNNGPTCDVSNWGEWSDCSSECDIGSRTRNRHYEYPDRSSDCTHDLYEVNSCRGNEANCPPPREPVNNYGQHGQQPQMTNMGFGGNYGGSNDNYANSYEPIDRNCLTSEWSNWSPCSNKCGSGYKRRTRLYIVPFVPNRSCDVRLYDKIDCHDQDPSCETYGQIQNYNSYPEIDNYEASAKGLVQPALAPNTIYNLPEQEDTNETPDLTEGTCTLQKDSGSCHGHTERWYFDSQMRTCQSFSYTGCRGNRNNFADRQRCEEACIDSSQNNNQNQGNYNNRPQYSWTDGNMNQQYHTSYSPSNEDSRYNRFPALNLELEQPEEEIPMRPMTPLTMDAEIDCHVSAWSTWSTCTKSCGTDGWQTRHREVLVNPSTYGRSCPKKLMRRKKCRQMPCPADTAYWYQGSWRHMVDPDDE